MSTNRTRNWNPNFLFQGVVRHTAANTGPRLPPDAPRPWPADSATEIKKNRFQKVRSLFLNMSEENSWTVSPIKSNRSLHIKRLGRRFTKMGPRSQGKNENNDFEVEINILYFLGMGGTSFFENGFVIFKYFGWAQNNWCLRTFQIKMEEHNNGILLNLWISPNLQK